MRVLTDIFGETYARLYNALYREKNYALECAAILRIATARGLSPGDSVLDVGCGTGNHASIIADQGFQVVGVDQSNFMVDIARASHGSKLEFHDASWILNQTRKFALVYSLFDVMSYQITPQAAKNFLNGISSMAALGATVIIDAWHLPGLMSEPPKSREVTVEAEGVGFYRRSVTPSTDWLTGVTTLHYEIHIQDGQGLHPVNETHQMKAFTMSELTILAEDCGLAPFDFLRAPAMDRSVSATDWHICMVSTKIH